MKVILVTGVSGFIGARLATALVARGHRVIGTVRRHGSAPDGVEPMEADFRRDTDPSIWTKRLRGVEIVINAVGIVRQRHADDFELVHARTPAALFAACAAVGVARVIQVSALGADGEARSGFHRTKRAADDALRALPVRSVILQPSLVFGVEGASSRALLAAASLPLLGFAADAAAARVQPVHIEDLVDAVMRGVTAAGDEDPPMARTITVAAVGPAPLRFIEYVQALRAALGFQAAPVLPIPRAALALCSRLVAGPEALTLLERGNAAPSASFTQLLGHPPRDVRRFITSAEVPLLRMRARLDVTVPVLRASLATLWIGTAALSFGLYPRAQSYALLASVGVGAAWQPSLLNAGAALDGLLGLGILLRPQWRVTWLAQIALMSGYTLILTWRAPSWWLHPFAPLLKNIPLLAATLLLLALLPPRARR